jgi:hypothetical protein
MIIWPVPFTRHQPPAMSHALFDLLGSLIGLFGMLPKRHPPARVLLHRGSIPRVPRRLGRGNM